VALKTGYAGETCSIARALELVGERWTLLIVRDLFFGITRFGDLQRHLGLPKAVLATRLRMLETAGLVDRREYRPHRADYTLTDAGVDLWPVLHSLVRWGDEHAAQDSPTRVYSHAECGGELDAAGRCVSCGSVPIAADVVISPGPGASGADADDPVRQALQRPHRLLTPLLP